MSAEEMIARVLRDVADALPEVRFEKVPPPPGAIAYQGQAKGWIFLLCVPAEDGPSFNLVGIAMNEGYTSGPTIIKLTLELAQQAAEMAKVQTSS